MKTLLSTITAIFKSFIVVLTITAMVFGGANSAKRLFDAYKSDSNPDTELSESAQLLPGPSEPEEKPGNMDDGKPNTEPSAYLKSGLSVTTINSKDEIYSSGDNVLLKTSNSIVYSSNSNIPVSFSQVSTKLAEQFTLVGSKPSGTS